MCCFGIYYVYLFIYLEQKKVSTFESDGNNKNEKTPFVDGEV
jgi:hypothetical protein